MDGKQEKEKQEKKPNPHQFHRMGLKKRYLAEGLDSFADHQVLEMLLFYGIPYKDTNLLAHKLLERYGSLSAVLEADPHDLARLPGMGEHSAVLLTLIPRLAARYQKDKWGSKPLLDTTEALGAYGVGLFTGHAREVFYLLCLNAQNRLINAVLLNEGTVGGVAVYIRAVVEEAIRNKAKNVVLMHNHPGGRLTPSSSDMELTRQIVAALRNIKIPVLDHIIVANNHYLSFSEKKLLDY